MRKANKQTQGGVFLLNASNLKDTTDEQVQSIVKKAASRRGGRGKDDIERFGISQLIVRNGDDIYRVFRLEDK